MLEVWTRSRSWLNVRGLIAVVFGVLVVAWPNKDWFTLLSLYSAYALTDSIALFIQASKGGSARRTDPWPLLVVAILGIATGIATLYYWAARSDARVPDLPMVNPQVMVLFAWAVARGIYELASSVRLRRLIEGEWFMAGAGLLSLLLALLFVLQFGTRTPALIWITSLCLVVAGVLYVALSVKLSHSDKGFPHASGVAR